ncbi:STAS/SEC14 domain-containing protein [Archangium sp.]|jgi:hypothetical protein|uniref:STAS/SEC14 domain-containing protein n=1 Tax=Archangium sp. TaxID=1872627 RepID=UPI002ED86F12
MEMSEPKLFDDSRWPLLQLRLPGTLSSQGHETCLADFNGYLGRGEKFALLVDLARVGLVPLDQRWRQVEWFSEHELTLRQLLLGTALVVTSPVVRLSISAMLYFKPLPIPLATFAHLGAAEDWASDRIRDAGLAQGTKGR